MEDEPTTSLDLTSKTFDGKKAIYSDTIDGQLSEAKVYDSVEQCIAGIYGKDKKPPPKKDNNGESSEEVVERRFLPQQMPVASDRKAFRHVLTRMDEFTTGPLGTIRKWSDEKVKVKVWTRGINEIRGFLTGFIEAFDKHWNLALVDVDEHFNRKRKRKTYSSGEKMKKKLVPADLPVQFKIGTSIMRIIRIQGNYEVCVRHVPQVLVRGEQIAMIGIAQ